MHITTFRPSLVAGILEFLGALNAEQISRLTAVHVTAGGGFAAVFGDDEISFD